MSITKEQLAVLEDAYAGKVRNPIRFAKGLFAAIEHIKACPVVEIAYDDGTAKSLTHAGWRFMARREGDRCWIEARRVTEDTP